MAPFQDLYKSLGVAYGCSAHEINKAFRRLSLTYHPDKLPQAHKAEGEAKFKEINAARETLTDETQRAAYDQKWREDNARRKKDKENRDPLHQQQHQANAAQTQWANLDPVAAARDRYAPALKRWNDASDSWNEATKRWDDAVKRWEVTNNKWARTNYIDLDKYQAGVSAYETAKHRYLNDSQIYENESNLYSAESDLYTASTTGRQPPQPRTGASNSNDFTSANPYSSFGVNGWPYQAHNVNTSHFHSNASWSQQYFDFGPGYGFNFSESHETFNNAYFSGFSQSRTFYSSPYAQG
jgi:curved DNA-binding protein CbpA